MVLVVFAHLLLPEKKTFCFLIRQGKSIACFAFCHFEWASDLFSYLGSLLYCVCIGSLYLHLLCLSTNYDLWKWWWWGQIIFYCICFRLNCEIAFRIQLCAVYKSIFIIIKKNEFREKLIITTVICIFLCSKWGIKPDLIAS